MRIKEWVRGPCEGKHHKHAGVVIISQGSSHHWLTVTEALATFHPVAAAAADPDALLVLVHGRTWIL